MVVALSRSLWSYRGFVVSSVRREFQSRYTNSILGATWSVLNPLAMVFVYTVIFVQVMRARLPGADSTYAYSIYLCAGVFTWALFAEIVGRCQTVFIDNANLIKKSAFPRICLPAIVVASACCNFAIIFTLFLSFLLVSGNFPGIHLLALIPVLLIQIAFSAGLGIFAGVLNVFFRDVGHFMTIVLQLWFWVTPIVYPISIVPQSVRPFLWANPLVPLMTAYQSILVADKLPEASTLVYPLLCAVTICALGWFMYRRNFADMVDEL